MRSMLEAVAGGEVTRISDIQRYIKCTLLAATNSAEVLSSHISLSWLFIA